MMGRIKTFTISWTKYCGCEYATRGKWINLFFMKLENQRHTHSKKVFYVKSKTMSFQISHLLMPFYSPPKSCLSFFIIFFSFCRSNSMTFWCDIVQIQRVYQSLEPQSCIKIICQAVKHNSDESSCDYMTK